MYSNFLTGEGEDYVVGRYGASFCSHPTAIYVEAYDTADGEQHILLLGSYRDASDLSSEVHVSQLKDEEVVVVVPEHLVRDFKAFSNVRGIPWEDGESPLVAPSFWEDVAKFKCVVASCVGGHGRTGTTASIVLMLWLGIQPEAAIATVRKLYCREAVETLMQERYVSRMYDVLVLKKSAVKHVYCDKAVAKLALEEEIRLRQERAKMQSVIPPVKPVVKQSVFPPQPQQQKPKFKQGGKGDER